MSQRFSIAEICLWLFVIVLGIEIGAGLYETLVVLPLWTLGPPDSVVAYHQHNIAYPQFALNAGGRFWIYFTPLTGLTAILALLSGLRTHPEHRTWRITGSCLAIIVVISTFAWFVPKIIILGRGGAGLNGEQIASLTNWWVRLNWVRVVLYLAGWLAGLRAMRIPSG